MSVEGMQIVLDKIWDLVEGLEEGTQHAPLDILGAIITATARMGLELLTPDGLVLTFHEAVVEAMQLQLVPDEHN